MTPLLYGLALAGGHSRRMGRDKAGLLYRTRHQLAETFHLLNGVCERSFVSSRLDQPLPAGSWPRIVDAEPSTGPISGLVAAHAAHSTAAWLVLACDLPLVDAEMLRFLVSNRAPHQEATAFKHADGRLEPLCTIWEPTGLDALARASAAGESSPRSILEGLRARVLQLDTRGRLQSGNTPQEYEVLKAKVAPPDSAPSKKVVW